MAQYCDNFQLSDSGCDRFQFTDTDNDSFEFWNGLRGPAGEPGPAGPPGPPGPGAPIGLYIMGAAAGDLIKVKTVDANGTPTAWEPAGFHVTEAGDAIAQASIGIEDGQGGVVSVTAAELSNMKSNTLTSASIDANGLISFKNGNTTVFTLQLPIYNGGVNNGT